MTCASDGAAWQALAAQYPMPRGVPQLEDFYRGSMAIPGANGQIAARLDRDTSRQARRAMVKDRAVVPERGRTVHRAGLASGDCIRMAPSLFTTPVHVDAFAPAWRTPVAELAR